MATLTEKYWAGEKLKVKIYMEDNIIYEVTNSPEDDDDSFIYNINFSNNEGNDSVNPMGVMTSSTCDMEIYDAEDLLSPSNESSPYYNKLVNGIKIEVYMKGTGENDVYELCGEYYTTSFSGSYSDGTHGMAIITASDKLTTIGNKEVPKLKDYAGITLDKLIKKVFNGIGITDSMYDIDERLVYYNKDYSHY